MNRRRLPTFAFAAAVLLAAAGAPDGANAQREGYTYLSYAQPDVLLVSSADEDVSAQLNTPVLSGDSLVTGVGSRAEAVLADGNVVRVDGYTELRFERMAHTYEADDDRDLLYLVHGTAAVEVRVLEHLDLQVAATRDRALRLDTDDATILAASHGLFRVDAGRRGTEVYVLSGKVEVQGRGGRALVRAGQYAYVSGDSEIEVDVDAWPRDQLTRFVEERRDRTDHRETTRYVSSDFTYDYDTASFDDYGSWTYVSRYGTYCWRPSVPAGWTPYALGYWRWTPAGMTWVSAEPWGWLPYHYGTWVYDDLLGWLWIPGAEYSPAWVYWNYTPDWVGWCPIGYYTPYYDTYYRHTRTVVGGPRPLIYPHLRGHVAAGQIDPRGWHYVAARRLGIRLDPARDIVRGDRVSFRPGEIGVIATAPLRFERGSNTATSIQEAIRRIPIRESDPRAANEGLTAVLRRDRMLTPAAHDELRRTIVRAGQDPAYRQMPSESPRGAEKGASADSWRQGVDRKPASGASASEGPVRRGEASSPPSPSHRRGDEGWRSPSSPPPAPIQRRADRPGQQDDSGWRAPQPRVIERDRAHDTPPPREAPVHEAPRAAPQSAPAPAPQSPPSFAPQSAPPPAPQQAPAPPPARREGALRTFDGPAQGAPLRRA